MAIPDSLEDTTVAAMMNPGMSSWAALTVRARFVAGEKVLILGATGSAGQMAVQIARRLGAGRVVASGRNPEALAEMQTLGADSLISLSQEREALVSAFRGELTTHKIDVVLDYVWGAPAEALLGAMAQKGLQHAAPRLRYVQIGSSAGPGDFTAGVHPAQLRAGAAGQRLRQRFRGKPFRIHGSPAAGYRGRAFPPEDYAGPAERGRSPLECTGKRGAAGLSAMTRSQDSRC